MVLKRGNRDVCSYFSFCPTFRLPSLSSTFPSSSFVLLTASALSPLLPKGLLLTCIADGGRDEHWLLRQLLLCALPAPASTTSRWTVAETLRKGFLQELTASGSSTQTDACFCTSFRAAWLCSAIVRTGNTEEVEIASMFDTVVRMLDEAVCDTRSRHRVILGRTHGPFAMLLALALCTQTHATLAHLQLTWEALVRTLIDILLSSRHAKLGITLKALTSLLRVQNALLLTELELVDCGADSRPAAAGAHASLRTVRLLIPLMRDVLKNEVASFRPGHQTAAKPHTSSAAADRAASSSANFAPFDRERPARPTVAFVKPSPIITCSSELSLTLALLGALGYRGALDAALPAAGLGVHPAHATSDVVHGQGRLEDELALTMAHWLQFPGDVRVASTLPKVRLREELWMGLDEGIRMSLYFIATVLLWVNMGRDYSHVKKADVVQRQAPLGPRPKEIHKH